eukprot:6481440-Amphidinium_carterae.1
MGLDPERVSVHVEQDNKRVVCTTTKISPSQAEILTKLAMRTPLNRRVRSLAGNMVEAFLGHRATRLRGLLKTTHLVAPGTLAHAVRALTEILPNFAFTCIGVLRHANILQHTDPMTNSRAAMLTLVRRRCSLQVVSPVIGKYVCVDTIRHVAVFNPQQPHAVFADPNCLSLVVYQTKREVHKTQAIDLRALGFPVCATSLEPPTNYTDTDTDSQLEADSELAQVVPANLHTSWTLKLVMEAQVCLGNHVFISPTLPWELDAGVCAVQVSTSAQGASEHVCNLMTSVQDEFKLWCVCACSYIWDECVVLSRHEQDCDGIDASCRNGCNHEVNVHAWTQLVAGTIESAELSKLSQKVKDLGVNLPMKTGRDLITLDAKLRKFLRGDTKDPAKIRASLEACMKRWNMAVPEGVPNGGQDPARSSGSARQRARTQDVPRTHRGDDGEWQEVQQRRKKMGKKTESELVITLCQSAWSVPVRQESEFRLDNSAVYQVNCKEKLQHMALEAIHLGFAVMVVSPFRTTLGYAPPQQMVLPFVVCNGASRSKALLNVWVHQLSAETIVPVSPPEAIEVTIAGAASSSCILSADIDVFNFSHEDITEAWRNQLRFASWLPRCYRGLWLKSLCWTSLNSREYQAVG